MEVPEHRRGFRRRRETAWRTNNRLRHSVPRAPSGAGRLRLAGPGGAPTACPLRTGRSRLGPRSAGAAAA
eukprot:14464510-Alexandrium_andersonii.AAC.1